MGRNNPSVGNMQQSEKTPERSVSASTMTSFPSLSLSLSLSFTHQKSLTHKIAISKAIANERRISRN